MSPQFNNRTNEFNVAEDEVASWEKADAPSVDTLGLYLGRIGEVHLLTAAQERELARRMEDGLLAAERLAAAEQAGEDLPRRDRRALERRRDEGRSARERFIRANLRLVVSIAKRWQGNGVALDDLIQTGNIGLIAAVDKFDYRRGCRFSTHATRWIQQEVSRAVVRQGRTVRLPFQVVDDIASLKRAEAGLWQELGREPVVGELAERMGASEEHVLEIRAAMCEAASLDKPVGQDDNAVLGEFIVDAFAADPEASADAVDRRDTVLAALGKLPERERAVIVLRFGLGGEDPRTLEQVGRKVGISRERVRQIETKVIGGLREGDDADLLHLHVA